MRPQAAVSAFHTLAISRLAHELKAAGRSVIHMEFGQPSTGAPRRAIEAAQRVLGRDPMGYWDSPALREAIAALYRSDYALAIEPERILLTAGASPALLLALATQFSPGDRIAFARPGYVAYRNVVRALHMVPVEIACGPATRFQLTAEALAALDPPPAGAIIASPANPTGTIIAPAELRAIAALARERGIRLVSDEIYHGLSYGDPARSLLAFAPDALVVNSFSKYWSMAGWRLGWLVCPPDQVERIRAYSANFFLTPPSLAQHAALAAMAARDELDGHVETYRRNRSLLLDALPRLGLGQPGMGAIAPPDGAFYLYADVGHLTDDSLVFARRILTDTGVALATGRDFDPVAGHRYLRFSFAVTTAEVEEAVHRLRGAFDG